ncbi:hypothetical protein [Streptomyces atratus]|uniref:hypothetical protein n=1 Tax=Streptomyces atratus TaxID=1893 RepID=UPI0033FA2751
MLSAGEHPGPRVLVGHGLMVSVLLWYRERTEGEPMPLFLPEAPYVEPIAISDDELPVLITALLDDLDSGMCEKITGAGGTAIFRISEGQAVATVDSVSPSHSLDKKDLPHA